MSNRSYVKIIFFLTIIVIISLCFNRVSWTFSKGTIYQFSNPNVITNNYIDGWISSKVYNECQFYIQIRNQQQKHIKKPLTIRTKDIKISPLKQDYIKFTKYSKSPQYPYSKWECSNTSNTDFARSGEYCILSNIYYNSATDEYYFYPNPSEKKLRTKFTAPQHTIDLILINDTNFFQTFNLTAILTQPTFVAAPPDGNYAHGFLEMLGPRFWTIAECQYHASYINPDKIQIYYPTELLKAGSENWANYKRRSDGTYDLTRDWELMIQSMESSYPLLTYASFNKTNIMFSYMIFPGFKMSRSASWGYNYPYRKYATYPMPTQNYRRAYLANSEWILYHFDLQSKFEFTNIQRQLQNTQRTERIPVCNEKCASKRVKNSSTDDFTGEWIVVLNRAGVGRREIPNADALVQGLLDAFPDHSNPYLRVWPKQFNFDKSLYQTVRMARSIRLLIGVHGAGLSNAMFMRPGAVLFEINPYGCQALSFNFRRWAEVFNLQHALYVPTVGEGGKQDESCDREGPTTVHVKDVVDEVKNLLKNELEYRTGYVKRALDIMTDLSIVDYPPKGYEKILA